MLTSLMAGMLFAVSMGWAVCVSVAVESQCVGKPVAGWLETVTNPGVRWSYVAWALPSIGAFALWTHVADLGVSVGALVVLPIYIVVMTGPLSRLVLVSRMSSEVSGGIRIRVLAEVVVFTLAAAAGWLAVNWWDQLGV